VAVGQYDDAVKALCLLEPASLCRWLGATVSGSVRAVRRSESLSTATRQVDALIAIDDQIALHVEFQADSEPRFDLRMLDYRLRLYRLPDLVGIEIAQHVVMLGRGGIDHQLRDGQLQYTFAVHYLRDEPVAPLLADVGLAPFAALADLPDDDHRAQTLRAALDLIAGVSDDHTRAVLAQAAVDLAALRLDPATINATWEDSAMPIPSLLQRTHDEALQQGREAGREEFVGSMLRRRFGHDERIAAIAHGLAALPPDDCLARITAAADLDELADPGD
jgi:hypothetical protein